MLKMAKTLEKRAFQGFLWYNLSIVIIYLEE